MVATNTSPLPTSIGAQIFLCNKMTSSKARAQIKVKVRVVLHFFFLFLELGSVLAFSN